ncbi:MAG: glycosyltransferase, partial [Cryobacterium sp.]|nr:glycosyltransferase [Cryobacterium sp.]
MTHRPPYLSVVMPTHNVDTWVGECLHSILAQNFADLEVIVVDDHSSDQTVALVQRIAARDSRVILISADSFGGANARNLGAAAAGGDYLVFADGDDIVPQGAYRAMVTSLEQSGSDMVIGDFLKFSPIRTWRPSASWPAYRTEAQGLDLANATSLIRGRACWNKMLRRSFWQAEGILFPEVARSNDIVPMVTALTTARGIDVVHDVVYLYRERAGGSSMTSRAGTTGSVLSYFSQEVECGRLVQAQNDEALLAQYASLILQADGWVHLERFLAAVDVTDPQGVAELCSRVAELTVMMPAANFNRANLMRQVIFALVAAQR